MAALSSGHMNTYVVLLRGVNVGGKNSVSMASLRAALEGLGYENVASYINSGNVLVDSRKSATKVRTDVEKVLADSFGLDRESARAAVLTRAQLEAVVAKKPKGFGDQPAKFHSDAVFLIDFDSKEAMRVFSPREGVDTVWAGDGVIYSQRLSAMRTKSRLNRIVGTPAYKSMTIRSWNTTLKLLAILTDRSS